EPEETKGRGMAKMAVIGFALGLIIYMGVIFMIYLFAGLVRTPRELESALGVRMMRLAKGDAGASGGASDGSAAKAGGTADGGAAKAGGASGSLGVGKPAAKWDFIKRWGEKLVNSERALSAEEAAGLTCAELAAASGAVGVSGVAVDSDASGAAPAASGAGFFALSCDGAESLAGTFASVLVSACAKAGCTVKTGDPLEDKAALEALLASSGVLAVVGVDQTKRTRVFDALRLAADHNIPVVGYVSVR
ncbi:MAG: hypothetical protein K6C95_05765, partial [Lachnospiraceae bacterium]|nr:hypothetical protein [Lachnospiraceae bacterium]